MRFQRPLLLVRFTLVYIFLGVCVLVLTVAFEPLVAHIFVNSNVWALVYFRMGSTTCVFLNVQFLIVQLRLVGSPLLPCCAPAKIYYLKRASVALSL